MVDGITPAQKEVRRLQRAVKQLRKQKKLKRKKAPSIGLIDVAASDRLARALIKAPKTKVNILTDVKIAPRRFDLLKGRVDGVQVQNREKIELLKDRGKVAFVK